MQQRRFWKESHSCWRLYWALRYRGTCCKRIQDTIKHCFTIVMWWLKSFKWPCVGISQWFFVECLQLNTLNLILLHSKPSPQSPKCHIFNCIYSCQKVRRKNNFVFFPTFLFFCSPLVWPRNSCPQQEACGLPATTLPSCHKVIVDNIWRSFKNQSIN